MQGLGFSVAEIHEALAGQQSVVLQKVTEEVRNRVIEGIVKTINEEYILIITAGAIGTITSMFLSWRRSNIDSTAVAAM